MPSCWWAISRPRKRRVILTLSPSSKKRLIGAHLHVVVVIVDAGTHLDLFDLDDLLMLAGLGRLLLLLILVFAEVEDLADRRLGVGRDLDEIESRLYGPGQGIDFGHDADVLSRLVNQSYFAGPDCVVDPGPDGSRSGAARIGLRMLYLLVWFRRSVWVRGKPTGLDQPAQNAS